MKDDAQRYVIERLDRLESLIASRPESSRAQTPIAQGWSVVEIKSPELNESTASQLRTRIDSLPWTYEVELAEDKQRILFIARQADLKSRDFELNPLINVERFSQTVVPMSNADDASTLHTKLLKHGFDE